jgi:hypothetical protein
MLFGGKHHQEIIYGILYVPGHGGSDRVSVVFDFRDH